MGIALAIFRTRGKAFQQHSTVDGSGKDGLIHISVEDHDARRASDLANGYVAQFRDLSQHLAITEASQRRLFFQQGSWIGRRTTWRMPRWRSNRRSRRRELSSRISQARALHRVGRVAPRAQITGREVQIQGMQTYATGQNSRLDSSPTLESGRAAGAINATSWEARRTYPGKEFPDPKRGYVPKTGMEYRPGGCGMSGTVQRDDLRYPCAAV